MTAPHVVMQGPVTYYKPCRCGAKMGWYIWWSDRSQTSHCPCGRVRRYKPARSPLVTAAGIG